MSWFGDLFGFGGNGNEQRTDSVQTTNPVMPLQLPDYPEATGARQDWFKTLQDWGTQPGYGAIQPDWNDIWNNARGKVQRYFQGGPEGPGLNAQIKSSLARRGMSENPANETLLQRSGFQQGNVLQDTANTQATQQAALSEQGRRDWLQSIQQLAGLKPAFTGGGATTTASHPIPSTTQGVGDILTSVLSGGGNPASGNGINELLSIFGGAAGGGGDTGIGDINGIGSGGGGGGGGLFGYTNSDQSFGQNSKDVFSDPQTYQQLAQLVGLFCWVAAEVFPGGWDDPKTHAARYFIGHIGPEWFKNLYIKRGEKFAEFISNKPIIKFFVRGLFEVFAFCTLASKEVRRAHRQ